MKLKSESVEIIDLNLEFFCNYMFEMSTFVHELNENVEMQIRAALHKSLVIQKQLPYSVLSQITDHAIYVIAAYIDQQQSNDEMNWADMNAVTWSWHFFKDPAVGENFFLRMESLHAKNDATWILYWMGIRCGYLGKWIDQPHKCLEFISPYSKNIVKKLPPIVGKIIVHKKREMKVKHFVIAVFMIVAITGILYALILGGSK